MVRKNPIIFSIFIILEIGLIILFPINAITSNLKSYGEITESLSYIYNPLNISAVKSLDIESDLGNIDIEYVHPPLEYGIEVNIYIDMVGKDLANKIYLDIFYISCDYDETSISLIVKFQPNVDQIEMFSLIRDFDISIKINAEAPLDINAEIEHGNVNIFVPFGVEIYNMDINIRQGNISYEFITCYINGQIIGFSNQGNLDLKIFDVRYSQDAGLQLMNSEGTISLNINQEEGMENNITGIGRTNSGEIIVEYHDKSSEIGAFFKFFNYTGSWPSPNYWSGFPEDPESFYEDSEVGYIFRSFDHPAKCNYNFSLYKNSEVSESAYIVNLIST